MEARFVAVESDEEIAELARIASEIWHEYWPALIGEEQTDYMVRKFQSVEALSRDIREGGYEYWLMHATDDDRLLGYTGGHVERVADGAEKDRFFISKIYLCAPERGRGFASQTIRFYENLCEERGLASLYLTVNKHNELGIRAYKGKGFETIDAVINDIGDGFVMDDYIMEKTLSV